MCIMLHLSPQIIENTNMLRFYYFVRLQILECLEIYRMRTTMLHTGE